MHRWRIAGKRAFIHAKSFLRVLPMKPIIDSASSVSSVEVGSLASGELAPTYTSTVSVLPPSLADSLRRDGLMRKD